MTAYIAKCCFHSDERHQYLSFQDTTECCEIGCDCTELSEEKATVIEVMNHEYETDWVADDFELAGNSIHALVARKWPHTVSLGVYGRCLVINNTSSHDSWGYDDAVCTANYQTLQENWAELEALCDGGFSNCNTVGLQWNSPAPFDLIETIKALENYPLLDEELMSEIEQGWMQNDWNEYGLHDARNALSEVLECEIPESDVIDQALLEDIFGSDCNPPYYESGGGTVFADTKVIRANIDKYRAMVNA